MEHIETFINAKHGRAAIKYPHPSLKDILEETHGVIVYQDQVLLILQAFAGYSLGEADKVRKAMGKKIAELMRPERERFIDEPRLKGSSRDLAEEVFNLIEPFAGYAFNKAHSVSYALISYWTGYFKANYTLEYMASVLNSRLDNPEKVAGSIGECFRMGIPVLAPDVNSSGTLFAIGRDDAAVPALRFGLSAVKNVGEGAVRPLIEERTASGNFKKHRRFSVLGQICEAKSPEPRELNKGWRFRFPRESRRFAQLRRAVAEPGPERSAQTRGGPIKYVRWSHGGDGGGSGGKPRC